MVFQSLIEINEVEYLIIILRRVSTSEENSFLNGLDAFWDGADDELEDVGNGLANSEVLASRDVSWNGGTQGEDEHLVGSDVLAHLDDELGGGVLFDPGVNSGDLWLNVGGAGGQSLVNLLDHVDECSHGGLNVEFVSLHQVINDGPDLSGNVSAVLEAVVDGNEVVLASKSLNETSHEEHGISTGWIVANSLRS